MPAVDPDAGPEAFARLEQNSGQGHVSRDQDNHAEGEQLASGAGQNKSAVRSGAKQEGHEDFVQQRAHSILLFHDESSISVGAASLAKH